MRVAVRARVGLAALAAAIGAAGCGDPSIAIHFTIPDAYRADVGPIQLEVFSPGNDGYGCDQVAFGQVNQAELDATRQQDAVLRAGDDHLQLADLPRTGTKLFRATGSDATGLALVAGCATLGDVTDDVTVEIAGEPVAVPSLDSSQPIDQAFKDVKLRVTDAHQQRLGGVAVAWTETAPGPTGVQTGPTDLVTASDGVLTIAPPTPALAGPAALDLAVRWQAAPLASLTAFYQPATIYQLVLGGSAAGGTTDGAIAVGRIGPAGTTGFAILPPALTLVARPIHLVHFGGSFLERQSTPVAARAIGVVTVAPAQDAILTVTQAEWLVFDADGAALASEPSPHLGHEAQKIVSIGGCAPDDASRVLVQFDDGIRAYDAAGVEAVGDFFAEPTVGAKLTASGCVRDASGVAHRVVIYGGVGTSQTLRADLDGGLATQFGSNARGVGFTRAVGAAGPVLLANQIAVDGASIARFNLGLVGNKLVVTDLEEDAAASFALSSSGGDLDGDGGLDVLALLFVGGGTDPKVRPFVSLAVDHAGGHLVGLGCEASLQDPRVFVADFDGSGHDEILIGSLSGAEVVDPAVLAADQRCH